VHVIKGSLQKPSNIKRFSWPSGKQDFPDKKNYIPVPDTSRLLIFWKALSLRFFKNRLFCHLISKNEGDEVHNRVSTNCDSFVEGIHSSDGFIE